ncbi:hypothetical protein BD560DRAFT_329794, partial [Blakeslea trispora]
VKMLYELENRHKSVLKQCNFNPSPVDNLISPTIMKLAEVEDKADVSELWPFFV